MTTSQGGRITTYLGLDTESGRLLGCDQSKNVEVESTELITMRQVMPGRWVG